MRSSGPEMSVAARIKRRRRAVFNKIGEHAAVAVGCFDEELSFSFRRSALSFKIFNCIGAGRLFNRKVAAETEMLSVHTGSIKAKRIEDGPTSGTTRIPSL